MIAFKKILLYFKNPCRIITRHKLKKLKSLGANFSDEDYLKKMFKIKLGYELDFENPKTFNEKMQYLKIHDRKDIYTTMVDKHAVKEYVSSIIGNKHVAKEIGCWESTNNIDVESLPEKCVLKTTHGCGGMLIYEKGKTNKKQIEDCFNENLNSNYYYVCREWPYKNVKPQVIAEEFLKDDKYDVLPVYKFFCFNGEPYIAQVIQNDKHDNETIDYVDMDYNFLKLKQNYPNSKKKNRMPKPNCFDDMKNIAKSLTKNIPFVRCDLYVVNEQIYFSEFTFFSDAGFEKFHPKKWDKILGDLIDLSI